MIAIIKKVYRKLHSIPKIIRNKVNVFIINNKTKHIEISVKEIIAQENNAEGFNRYDIIVRLLAIECEEGKNDIGWNLYRKMQIARCGDKDIDIRIARFKKLIQNYEKNGYDKSYEIELDSNLHLIDGSHRIALALYYNIPYISAKVRPFNTNCYYGINFFIINGFSDKDCEAIVEKYKQIGN